jgi:hypothetical protein
MRAGEAEADRGATGGPEAAGQWGEEEEDDDDGDDGDDDDDDAAAAADDDDDDDDDDAVFRTRRSGWRRWRCRRMTTCRWGPSPRRSHRPWHGPQPPPGR